MLEIVETSSSVDEGIRVDFPTMVLIRQTHALLIALAPNVAAKDGTMTVAVASVDVYVGQNDIASTVLASIALSALS